MDNDRIELTLLINRSVKVYRIPPRGAAGGHRSGEWQVADEIFSGRLRVVARGEQVHIRIEDASTGELFASCPFTPATQSVAVEPAADSSRYYVLRVEDAVTRRHAFLGLGFAERGQSFDFQAALADHAKQCQRESMLSQQQQQQPPPAAPAAAAGADAYSKLDEPQQQQLFSHPGDLSLKEGQTIKIDIHHRPAKPGGFLSRSSGGGAAAAGASSSSSSGGVGLLPPPVLPPPPMGSASGLSFPPAAAISTAAVAPAAVTVADNQESWAQFD